MVNDLLLAAQLAAQATVAMPDACAPLIPPRLAEVIQREASAYDLPRAIDAGAERLKKLTDQGDWPCPFVVLGDFDGNGELDRAVLLKNRTAPGVRLIAALNTAGSWQISLSTELTLPMADTYLRPLEAGLYQKSTTKPAADLDEIADLQSERSGFLAGELNARSAAYFFQESRWRHVWLSE